MNDTVTLSKKMKRLGRRGISVDDRTDCQVRNWKREGVRKLGIGRDSLEMRRT